MVGLRVLQRHSHCFFGAYIQPLFVSCPIPRGNGSGGTVGLVSASNSLSTPAGLLFPFAMLGEDHNAVGLIRTPESTRPAYSRRNSCSKFSLSRQIASVSLNVRTGTQLDLVQALNKSNMQQSGRVSSEVEGVIESYELAFRMQAEVPKVLDLSKETEATKSLYGIGDDETRQATRSIRHCVPSRRRWLPGL